MRIETAETFFAVFVLLLLLGVIGVPFIVLLSRDAPWALPTVVGISFILADAGYPQAGSWQRYLSTGSVIAVAWLVRSRTRSRVGRSTRMAIQGIALYTILGSVLGRIVRGTTSGALPIGIPMLVALVGPSRIDEKSVKIRLGLTALAWASLGYTTLMWLTLSGALETSSLAFGHEKAFISILGLGCAWSTRRPLLFLANAVACAGAFVTYPAATFAVALLAALVTFSLCRQSPGPRLRRTFAIIASSAALIAFFRAEQLIRVSSGYFKLVGKANNGLIRQELIHAADQIIRQNPAFSSFFLDSVSIQVTLAGQPTEIPIHNDYLTLAVGGGITATIALILVVLLVNGLALNGIRLSRAAEASELARALPPLLAAFNAAAVSAFANPVLLTPQSGAVVWAIALVITTVAARASQLAEPNHEVNSGTVQTSAISRLALR